MYNHNSQFSSYNHHESYESISVQSSHIFITNYMSTIQYQQVAQSSPRVVLIDIHINRQNIYLSQIIWMHITSLASKHKHISPTGHTIMNINTHSQLGTNHEFQHWFPTGHTTITHPQKDTQPWIQPHMHSITYNIVRKCPYLSKLPTHQLTLRENDSTLTTKSCIRSTLSTLIKYTKDLC